MLFETIGPGCFILQQQRMREQLLSGSRLIPFGASEKEEALGWGLFSSGRTEGLAEVDLDEGVGHDEPRTR